MRQKYGEDCVRSTDRHCVRSTDTAFLARQVIHRPEADFNDARPHHEEGLGTRSRSEEHTSELQSLMRISYAVFCLKKKKKENHTQSLYTQKKEKHHNTT